MEDIYLRKTRLLDYGAPQIQQLIRQRKWTELDPFHRIGAIYDYVQREAVVKDFGVFDSPDSFFSEHPQKWGRLVDLAYVHLGRKLMNRRVDSIRRRG